MDRKPGWFAVPAAVTRYTPGNPRDCFRYRTGLPDSVIVPILYMIMNGQPVKRRAW
jgi:hypothetical protein